MLGDILATCPKMASRRLLMLSITGRRPVCAATSLRTWSCQRMQRICRWHFMWKASSVLTSAARHGHYSLLMCLTHHSRSTSSTMYCVVCKLNVSTLTLRPTTIAKIRLRTDCCNAFPQFLKYGSESSMEWKFLGHLLLRSKSSREQKFHGAKVLWLFAPRERMFQGTKVPWERKFHLWIFRSREWKCRGTKSLTFLETLQWPKLSKA